MARANPRRTLDALLKARDYDAALGSLTRALRRTWDAGYSAGWRDGVSDAVDEEPVTTNNPYP